MQKSCCEWKRKNLLLFPNEWEEKEGRKENKDEEGERKRKKETGGMKRLGASSNRL